MVWHMVWFQFNDDVTETQKQQMVDGLNALPSKINEIQTLACGEDFSGRSQGYHVGLVSSFASRADLEIYSPHPDHRAFVERFKPLWKSVMAFDFES